MAIVKHYGGHFETTIFKREIKQQIATDSKKLTTAVVKHYGIERRSVFSTEGSFGSLDNRARNQRLPLIKSFEALAFGVPWESTENRHFHSQEPYTKPYPEDAFSTN